MFYHVLSISIDDGFSRFFVYRMVLTESHDHFDSRFRWFGQRVKKRRIIAGNQILKRSGEQTPCEAKKESQFPQVSQVVGQLAWQIGEVWDFGCVSYQYR